MITREKKQDVFLQVRIDKETREKFNQICDEKTLNRSALFRRWIQDFVKKYEEEE